MGLGRPPSASCRIFGFAFRTVRTSPGFSLAVGLTLAVGLGLCSFLFNTLDALFLRPAPGVREPARLVASQAPVSFPYFERYRGLSRRGRSRSRRTTVPFRSTWPWTTATRRTPSAFSGHLVSLEYFSTLGARAPPRAIFRTRSRTPRWSADGRGERALLADPAERRFPTSSAARSVDQPAARHDRRRRRRRTFRGCFRSCPADIFVPVTVDACRRA